MAKMLSFNPKEDITAFETAKSLELLLELFNWYNRLGFEKAVAIIKSYPENVQRHFKIE